MNITFSYIPHVSSSYSVNARFVWNHLPACISCREFALTPSGNHLTCIIVFLNTTVVSFLSFVCNTRQPHLMSHALLCSQLMDTSAHIPTASTSYYRHAPAHAYSLLQLKGSVKKESKMLNSGGKLRLD